MSRYVSVKFRGAEHDVEIDADHGYESDTNAHVIEWHFVGLSADDHEALKLTDDEENAIHLQLAEYSEEYDPS